MIDWEIHIEDENLPAVLKAWNNVKKKTYILLKQLHAYCLEKDLDEARKKAEADLAAKSAAEEKNRMFIRVRHMDNDK